MSLQPRRVLLISATIGEGHNATARAVAEAAEQRWPGCEVSWVDALAEMGGWVPRTFNWIYATNVESTPWLYDLFYSALWRWRWFADSSRRFVGAWSGRRLRAPVAAHRPDLIVSTYPLGTAGLDWLRRRGELREVPIAAVISDFSPHPFWVYPEVDLHHVMSEVSLREMRRAEPDAVGAVSVPPAVGAFHPADRTAARTAAGLPADGFAVVITCGSLGFGSVERAVRAARRADGVDRVVVVCGRNAALRQRLTDLADPRVVPLGWVEDMPGLMAAADAVITNAGGATALEALACGRAVVMFEPIAGHGKANAELMAEAELAELCWDADQLTALLRRWTEQPDALTQLEQRALKHAQAGDFAEQVAALAEVPRHHGRRPLRPQDAFFVHATTPTVPQQIGTVLRLTGSELSTHEWGEHLTERIRTHAAGLPMLNRRLVRRRGRRPEWVHDASIDPADHLRCREPRSGRQHADLVEEFFRTPVRTDRPPWELLLIQEEGDEEATLLAKMHHALGDGIAVNGTLVRLLCDVPPPHARRPGDAPPWYRRAGAVLRGLVSLARVGAAPAGGFTGRSTPDRTFGWLELSAREVRATARERGVSSSALLLAAVAEGLHRLLDDAGGAAPEQRVRVMVPKTMRTARGGAGLDAPGNHTASFAVDLPVGPMPVRRRLAEVTARLAAAERGGHPAAAVAVLRALGALPAPLHALVVRTIYRKRFFHAVVSVMPGRRSPAHVAGALIEQVLPVLSLADGVGIGIGAINWGEGVGFGITTDPGLAPHADALAEHVRGAFGDLRRLGAHG
ncbi:MGDG synthase family glycosyltransferase [Saccharopolyspora sp. CA-218241]|uniref:MGDG synthase family glycosyltransferase n=1 Tax=Saccharopolyspora sp. CA-218241 TaxID=3240027 RepID=UPI003D974657